MWQGAIVVLLVLASAAYAVWALTPAHRRPALAAWTAALLSRCPGPLARLGARIERSTRSMPAAGGCSACPQTRIKDPSREASPPRR